MVPLRSPDARVSACQRGLGAQGAAALVVAHFMLCAASAYNTARPLPHRRGSAAAHTLLQW